MVHRRKSAHPVCKTKRNLGATWGNLTQDDDDHDDDDDVMQEQDDVAESQHHHEPDPCSSGIQGAPSDDPVSSAVAMEMEDTDDGQQIVIPPDLYKDFQAVRSQTKLDATDLMRRLLKDYQSLASNEDNSPPKDVDIPDKGHLMNVSMATTTSINSDVSLATTRIQSDDEEYHGLDLSLSRSKYINQTTSNNSMKSTQSSVAGKLDQPLDLTCSKPSSAYHTKSIDFNDRSTLSNADSPDSLQLGIDPASGENYNYVYVCPGIYPPGTGPLSPVEKDNSPPPRLISPVARSDTYTPAGLMVDAPFSALSSGLSYNNFMSNIAKAQLSPLKDDSMESKEIAATLQNMKQEAEISPNQRTLLPKYFRMTDEEEIRKTPKTSPKAKKEKSKEMKILSENTSFTGVYTSVLKLPWSRRARTKKPHATRRSKHDKDNTNTETSAAMQLQGQMTTPAMPGQIPPSSSLHNTPSSESVMMVYPNSYSTMGKPVRKRGRPPKLPMLAKLLHDQNKRFMNTEPEPEVKANEVPQEMAQHVQTHGGMVVYNSGGQIMTAIPGMMPLPTEPTPVVPDQPSQCQSQAIPSFPQAQFIGQFQLHPQLNAAGQIQFVPVPIQGQPAIQGQTAVQGQTAITCQTAMQGQLAVQGQTHIQGQICAQQNESHTAQFQEQTNPSHIQESPTSDGQLHEQEIVEQNKPEPPKPDAVFPSIPYQYAFQPMLVPTPMQHVTPPQIPVPLTSPANTQIHAIPQMTYSMPNQTAQSSSDHTHVMTHSESGTVSTMSTTSISNTDSGAVYQEMILSSKSLKKVKPRRRQTAIQALKHKAANQDFLCTSFRIRPRLVAQAQAQRERMAAKGVNINENESIAEISPKNLYVPQNDTNNHFGENCINGFESVQNSVHGFSMDRMKYEVEEDEYFEKLREFGIDAAKRMVTDIKEEPDTSEYEASLKAFAKQTPGNKCFLSPDQTPLPVSDQTPLPVSDQHRTSHNSGDAGQESPTTDNCSSVDSTIGGELSADLFQELFNCKICNDIIPLHEKENHRMKHATFKYECKECGIEFQSNSHDENENNEPIECEKCHSEITKIEIGVSPTRQSNAKVITCDECGEFFRSLPVFYEHKTEVHKNENSADSMGDFDCDDCGKSFQYYHALQFHRRTHRTRKVTCLDKDCNQRFRSMREMERHFDSRHPDTKEQFYCVYEGCSKKFLKNFHLQEHIRVKHQKIKAFQCTWPGCEKEFAAQRHLKIHLLIHSDEKPMACDHCDYRCRQRSAMNWHMRKHPDVPYKYKRWAKSPSVSAAESE